MNKEDKIKRLMALLKGEPIEDAPFRISIIDKTSDPIMLYDNIHMENGVPLTEEEYKAYQSVHHIGVVFQKNRTQANRDK